MVIERNKNYIANTTYCCHVRNGPTPSPVPTPGATVKGETTEGKQNTGRGRNNIKPDLDAQGSHSVFKRDPNTGEITNYKTYEPNPKNPSGFDEVIGYDGVGKSHANPVTGEDLMPHVHDKTGTR